MVIQNSCFNFNYSVGGLLECGLSELIPAISGLAIDNNLKASFKEYLDEAMLVCPIVDNLLKERAAGEKNKSWV